MQQAIIFLIELTVLFFVSSSITQTLFTLFYALFHSKKFALGILTLLYLPGTIIHELAHLFTAEILRVQSGKLTVFPVVYEHNNRSEVKLGSVEIAETDPFRRLLIGIAPLFSGVFFLSLTIWAYAYFLPQITANIIRIGFTALIGYLLFTISNNMFSSKKDLEGFIVIVPVLILICTALYLSGIRLSLTGSALTVTMTVLNGLTRTLGLVIGINVVILLVNRVALRGIVTRNKF